MEKQKENLDRGFIKIFRSLKKHWIWQDEKKLKWWLDILIEVNHADNKVSIGFDLIDCVRGQSLRSLEGWAKEWKVDKSTVRRFFDLLKNDKMIVTENVKKTTRLTVCNYASYNGERHAKQLRRNPNNNDKNINTNTLSKDIEAKQKVFYNALVPFVSEYGKEMLRSFYEYWSEPCKNGKEIKWERESTWDLKLRLSRWKRNQREPPKPKVEVKAEGPVFKSAQQILEERGKK